MPEHISRLSGELYRDMLLSGAHALQKRMEEINRLNVYPVPDGDTGSNMSMTVSPIEEMTDFEGSLEAVASKTASRFLRSARGNSGVILSLFFRGVSRGFQGMESAGAEDVRKAFQSGVREAYKAVQDPKEGTILTVMRVSSEVAYEQGDMLSLFRNMLASAKETLAITPDLLPVLKQAGVVDSGGTGYTEILGGMLAFLEGRPVPGQNDGNIFPHADAHGHDHEGADFASFDTSDIVNPYCTECIITKRANLEEAETEAMRRFVLDAGDSAVFAEDDEIIKIHVHTRDPGRVLSEALKYGSLFTVKVENMRNQHTKLLEEAPGENGNASEANSGNEAGPTVPESEKAEAETVSLPPDRPYGFVAVTMGDGIRSAFADLGVEQFVYGGQTMNPSTSQLADAVGMTPAETVFILPNNGNVCLVAEQAAKMIEDRRAVVIPSLSVPMGMSAMMAFDPDASPDENAAAMKEAMKNVRTAEITFAAHDAVVNGQPVRKGQILGLIDHRVVYACDALNECLNVILSSLGDAGQPSFLTIFAGQDVSEEEAKETERLASELYPDTDSVLLDGGQPLYYYVISAEF